MINPRFLLPLPLIFASLNALASQCPAAYLGNAEPVIYKAALTSKTRELCLDGYALLHSGVSRSALYVSEILTKDSVRQAKGMIRRDSFHADPRLPLDERAELNDYKRSGFDRGHLRPSADAATPEEQHDTFTLANMTPQRPESNRGLWERIERATRLIAFKAGTLHVVTGPVYTGSSVQRLKGRVMVPTHYFKALYSPKTGQAAAYLVENSANDEYRVLSIAELTQITGIDVFPSLPSSVKAVAGPLPNPLKKKGR